ncbi:unnamed protein product, partial [Staurois parvus]
MHSPKKKNTKLSICRVSPHNMSSQEIRGGYWKKGWIREDRIKQH